MRVFPDRDNIPHIARGANIDIENAGFVYGTNQLVSFSLPSSIRFKENVRTLETDDKFMELNPVRFNYKNEKEEKIGFIAEQVEKIYPEFVKYEIDRKTPKGIDYEYMVAIAIGQIQALKLENQKLTERINIISDKIGKMSEN